MFRGPSEAGFPPFSFLLQDVPARPAQVARYLGMTERTLLGYAKHDNAPRPVMLATFWETKWGRSAADCEAANWGARYYALAMSLERENKVLKLQLAELEQALARGDAAANTPFIEAGSLARKVWQQPLNLVSIKGLPGF